MISILLNRNIIFEVNLPEIDDGTPLFNITFNYTTRYKDKIVKNQLYVIIKKF